MSWSEKMTAAYNRGVKDAQSRVFDMEHADGFDACYKQGVTHALKWMDDELTQEKQQIALIGGSCSCPSVRRGHFEAGYALCGNCGRVVCGEVGTYRYPRFEDMKQVRS